jgi:hypothetical protein
MLNARLFFLSQDCDRLPRHRIRLAQQTIKPPGRRIVGGENGHEKHPWQVALRFQGSFFCGGSIIEQMDSTAAHCLNFDEGGRLALQGRRHQHVTTGVWSDVDRIIAREI